MKLRIWHFVTPTPTEWQEDKPADDNGTAEYFLDGCVAAHRTASNGWQTSPTRTPQRIWFLENVAGGPPEDIDGAWVRCYFDPQSGRWVALGLERSNAPMGPEDPANNDDCCEFGQLFICPLPAGIEHEVLCSAIDPPIDGEKMYKVRFFAVDENGDEILPADGSSEILEHREILTLPCTSEVCKNVDLSNVTLNGVSIGRVTYGNRDDCCRLRLVVSWETVDSLFAPPVVIQRGTSLNFVHTTTITADGNSLEVTIDAEIIDALEHIRTEDDFTNFTIRSTLTANQPISDHEFLGTIDPSSHTEDQLGNSNTATIITETEMMRSNGRVTAIFSHPLASSLFSAGNTIGLSQYIAFIVSWSYLDTEAVDIDDFLV